MSKKQKIVIAEADTLFGWVDGACAGNPGPMGIGGLVKNAEGLALAVFSIHAGSGTNNEAEYLAAIQCIELAAQLGAARLQLWSDSDLIVHQFSGHYEVTKPHLQRLCDRMHRAARSIPGGVAVQWVSRVHNAEADALASRAAGMPQAPLGGEQAIGWQACAGYLPEASALAALPAGPPSVKALLRAGTPKFGDFIKLKTGGADGYSRMPLETCKAAIGLRHGPGAVAWLVEALGTQETGSFGKSAIKWCARGLPPDLALKKASVDVEMAANARR